MILFILGLVAVAFCIGLLVWGIIADGDARTVAGAICSIILGLVVLISSIAVPITKQGELQQLVAFYEANSLNYEATIDQTKVMLSEQRLIEQALIPIEGSIERTDLAKAVSERISEWRNKLTWYNEMLAQFLYFDKNSLIGYYWPTPPDHLKFIIIK